MKKEICWSIF